MDGAAEENVELHAIEPVDLERALGHLPEGARTALLLTDLWEFDHEEVARILDVPVGTVKSRVARARARLAVLLADYQRSAPAEKGA
jgi:RNA polymerase sigma-70 factor (ECF subfamily)